METIGKIAVAFWIVMSAATSTGAEKITYEKHIRPIFVRHCVACHGSKRRAELDLRTPQSIHKGGESGTVLNPRDLKSSLLLEVVHERRMPPKGRKKLSKAEIELIRKWILAGAKLKSLKSDQKARLNQHTVLPILRLRCTVCHGRQSKQGGLDLRTKVSILKGGKSGPAMVLGKPQESLMLKRIHAGQMPPKSRLAAASVKPMEEGEIGLLTKWIAAGGPEEKLTADVASIRPDPLVTAEDRKFWSFQTPRAARPPKVKGVGRIRNPIDAFVLRKLEDKGLRFSAEADRLTLVRRAAFDLIGLPPSPVEVARFLADRSPGAYERMIDGFLASQHYGERWGRYWLDVAGYSDSEGGQHADRVRPEAYRYRDYVIRSFNSDKPYDRFLIEQIAGDELANYRQSKKITTEIYDNLVATGFLRMAPDSTYAGITAFVPDRLEIIDDEIEVLSSSVMGLTIRCARCHSHKFDPIPQRDYYRLAAVLKGALDEHDWLEPTKKRYLPFVSHKERQTWQANEKKLSDEVQVVQSQLDRKQKEYAGKHAPKKLNLAQLKKAEPAFAKLAAQAATKIKAINARRKSQPQVRALWDRGEPTPTYILKRGNYLTPGRLVGPGVPSVLTDGRTPLKVRPPFSGATGRRLAFARWLTKPDHPLTARVIVNRIWNHHFGQGLVSTLDNFGKAGARPTHPQLLDWLAVRFVRQGWSMKAMHRLMMTSATYRQTSDAPAQLQRVDPANRLLSRMPLRRMEGEILRDSLLYVAGRLDLRPFGPADPITARGDGLVLSVGRKKTWRRTIYVLQRRTAHLTILDNFDLPQMNPNCVARGSSIVAPQALHLLNNQRVHELSQFFAKRIRQEAGDNPARQIRRIYELAIGRRPTAAEARIARGAFEQLKQDWLRKLKGVEVSVKATTQLWIRKITPDRVWESDLISVWSSAKDLRYGLVEFDVSQLSSADWKSARLELGWLNGRPIKQSASLIPAGIRNATWNSYQKNMAKHRRPLQKFGRIERQSGTVGTYVGSSPASESDLKRIVSMARKSGRLAFVLIADEDGKSYWHDWDDGSKGKLPRLVIHKGPPDPAEAARRALQNVCHAIMNSAGFLYID